MQVGGLAGSMLYSILINYISIPGIWMIAASVVLIAVAVVALKFLKKPPVNANAQ
jgi:predicted MFS family arabinose efflux permease